MFTTTLYTRVLLLVGAVLLTAIVATNSFYLMDEQEEVEARLNNQLIRLSEIYASAVARHVWELDSDTTQQVLRSLSENPDFHHVVIHDNVGRVYVEIGETLETANNTISHAVPINITTGVVDNHIGDLTLTLTKNRLYAEQESFLQSALIMGVIQLIAVLLATAAILKLILSPMNQITSALIRLGDGRYETETPSFSGNHEVSAMADAVASFRESLIEADKLRQEERAFTQKLAASRDHAEQANRAKSDFLSSMSHELRTPMNAIIGFTQILKSDSERLTEEQRIALDHILSGGDHLLGLIEDILDLSRIEARKLDISLAPVSVTELIGEILPLTAPLAEQRNMLVSNLLKSDVYIWADKGRMKQIVLNLVSNAIKYNKENGAVFIEDQKLDNDTYRLKIRDTGDGIDPAARDKVFEPFIRLNKHSTQPGVGIGLSITKSLVETMGGQLDFESVPGEGSTFWVQFSIADKPAGEHSATASFATSEIKNVRSSSTKKVLYIEDNETNQALMRMLMAKLPNFELVISPTAEAGLGKARKIVPDLILMDINLPGLSGIDALKIIQDDEMLKNIPVIAVSADAMQDTIDRGLALGFKSYVTKPFKLAEITEALEQELGSGTETQNVSA